MRNQIVNISMKCIFLSVLAISCNTSNEKLLHNKWKSVYLSNTKMDAEIASMKHYIDTVGNRDEALRRTLDTDSLKNILQAELDNAMKEQEVALENTLMEFRPDGKVYSTSVSGVDSAMYTVEENTIVIDESKMKGYGETLKMEILKLSRDTLHVKMVLYGDTSVVVMVPVGS